MKNQYKEQPMSPVFVIATDTFKHPTVPLERFETFEGARVSQRLFPNDVFKLYRLEQTSRTLLIKGYSEEIKNRLANWAQRYFPNQLVVIA